MYVLLRKGDTNAELTVQNFALELALTTVHNTTAGEETMTASFASFCFLVCPKYESRAVLLGGVEVRFLVVQCGAV